MAGIDARTGMVLEGFDHVQQSIEKLLTTYLGERIMREYVGNPGTRLLGENLTDTTILKWFAIVWAVLEIFEPRFRITRFRVNDATRDGMADFTMAGEYRPYAHLDFVQATLFVSVGPDGVTIKSAA